MYEINSATNNNYYEINSATDIIMRVLETARPRALHTSIEMISS